MKISQREMGIGVLTLAIVLATFTWYIVDGKLADWHGLAQQATQTKQQIHRYQTAIRMHQKWTDDLNKLQSQLRVFKPSQRSVSPDLMKTIKSISSKHGLDITRSQPYAEKPTGDLFEMGINCSWQGSLEALVGFLAELQQQGVRYDVRQLQITPQGKGTTNLKGSMLIHCAYTRKETPAPKPKPQKAATPKSQSSQKEKTVQKPKTLNQAKPHAPSNPTSRPLPN